VYEGERGESLIETVVSVAIIALFVGAIAAGTIAAAHRFGPDPVASALEETLASEMRIAVDLLKYQGASVPPASIATTIPLPSGSPLPAQLSLATTTANDGSVTIVLTATSTNDPAESATLTQTIAAPAPLPGARIPAASSGAAPQ